MQIFLVYPDIEKSAGILDKARCWKQVLECKQILIANLELVQSPFYLRTKSHPVARAFSGFPGIVRDFGKACAKTCIEKHGFNPEKLATIINWFDSLRLDIGLKPWFFGNRTYHSAIRANLLAKKPGYYSVFVWSETPDLTRVYPGILPNEWIVKE